MPAPYQSEIRDSQIRDLSNKVKGQNYGSYLKTIRLVKVRAFDNEIVNFDFPVTAIIGTNGGGKSTILGAAAIAYKSIKPAIFSPKSSIGDDSMENWRIEYEMIDKSTNPRQPIPRSARFKRSKWVRDDLIDRPVINLGINRTVPAGERREFKKLATVNYAFSGSRATLAAGIRSEAEKVLGKDVSRFEIADITPEQSFYVGGDGNATYSEFHFGAGESSILRMVGQIELAAPNTLVLIEEIENGLHPVAVRRMVEYLLDVADRKSIQAIFTTHSEDALLPLPSEAIWSSIDGKVRHGRVSIEALRAITGRVDQRMAIFVEDAFAKGWVEAIIRSEMPARVEEIGIYPVSGDGQAYSVHNGHRNNPALIGRLKSLCILDGDSRKPEELSRGIIKLPGAQPENVIFNYVRNKLDELSMKITVALHVSPEKEAFVKTAIEDVSRTNRDPHLLFNQVGQKTGFTPEKIVSSAFITQWIDGNRDDVKRISDFITATLDEADTPSNQ
jgi:ABC-type branched-subunit amino acid transport system ATPase component